MNDQIRISDSGELETEPTTWDDEPLYSPSTVAEGLFDPDAFKQMRGQTSMSECMDCGAAISPHPDVAPRCTFCATMRAIS